MQLDLPHLSFADMVLQFFFFTKDLLRYGQTCAEDGIQDISPAEGQHQTSGNRNSKPGKSYSGDCQL